MAIPVFPIMINGAEYSAVSAELDILGDICKGIKALNYKQEAPHSKVQGTGTVAVAIARGAYNLTLELTMFKSWADVFQQKLIQRGITLFGAGTNYGDVPFDIGIRYVEKQLGGQRISTVEARTVYLDSDEESFEAGAEGATEVKYALMSVRPLRKNGNTMVVDPFGDQTTAMVAGIQSAG